MRLTIAHVADLHIGKNRRYADYLEQQRWMLEGIIRITMDLAASGEPVWLVVAGDVFERNEDTNRAELALFMIHFLNPILDLARLYPEFRCVMIDGNHDRQPQDPPSVLSPFDSLSTSQVTIRTKYPLHLPELSMLLVPFGNWTDQGLRTLLKESPSQFMVAHECLARMVTDQGWTPPRDQDHYCEIENVLEGLDLAGVFMGDIHRCQPLDRREICWYSGSPVTHDFGHKLPKGVLVHRFRKTPQDLWARDGRPELVDLPDDRIRSHHQLGKIIKVDEIPMDFLRDFRRKYLSLTVTPETYQVIDKELPDFFHAQQVSYEFDRVESSPEATTDPDLAVDDTIDRGAIARFIDENLIELSKDERDEAFERVMRDFASR